MRPVFAPAGSTGFTRSDSALGALIRYEEREKGEEPTWANHSFVVVESGWIGEPLPASAVRAVGPTKQAVVVEALWKVRKGPLKVNGVDVRIFVPVPAYTPAQLSAFRAKADSYVGDTYGWWKLIGFSIKKRLGINIPLLYRVDDRPICSYLAAQVNQAAWSLVNGLARLKHGATSDDAAFPFGMPPQAADPDEMMDFCLAHPEWWREME